MYFPKHITISYVKILPELYKVDTVIIHTVLYVEA